jgi:NADPH:quinone reductase-like Zn-dependent oxidoreductase
VLTPKGTFVLVGGQAGRWVQPAGHMFSALAAGPLVSQRMVRADVVACKANKQNLMTLTEFIEDGKITPVIDRSFPFEEISAAVRYQEAGHAPGKVVIAI